MKRAVTISFAMLALAGCQATPEPPTQASSVPARECRFDHGQTDIGSLVRQSIRVLEEQGFNLRSVDSASGVISARRERSLGDDHGGFDGRRILSGISMFGGFGSGGSSTFGLGIGARLGNERSGAAKEIDDVTLLIDQTEVQIAREIRRFDSRGHLREHYNANHATFCGQLRQALMD